MHWADLRRVLALPLLCCLGAHAQDKSTYGKVDTFEPGKKYSCVPTPDRKGWDCTQSGKAADKPAEAAHEAATPRAEAAPAQSAPPPTIAAPPPAAAAPPSAPASATHASELPSYLNARSSAPPRAAAPTPAPAAAPTPESAPVAAAPVAAPTETAPASPPSTPVSAPAPAETTAQTAATPAPAAAPERPAATPAPPPVAATPAAAPPPAEPAAPPAERAPLAAPAAVAHIAGVAGTNTSAFLALPGEQYVIELAHGAEESDLAGVDAPAHGEVYKLHLRQNGADRWLLVWGSFPDVAAARAARAEITQGTPGWPRRIAPLQTEVRRAGD